MPAISDREGYVKDIRTEEVGRICLLLGGAESAAAMPTALIAAFLGAVLCELCLTHFWRFPLMRTHAARLCLWGIIAMMVPGAELAAFAGGAGAGALCSWICHLRERRDPRFVHTPHRCCLGPGCS